MFCSCAFVFAVVHLFLQLCYFFGSCAIFFAVVLISCMIPTYNFAVVPFILQLYNFFCSCTIFLQLYNFFAVVQKIWQLYNLLPNPLRFWTMLKGPILRRSGTKKRSLLGDSPLSGDLRDNFCSTRGIGTSLSFSCVLSIFHAMPNPCLTPTTSQHKNLRIKEAG